MWSRIKELGLAWRLTMSSALVFSLLLVTTSVAIIAGVYYAIFKHTEQSMRAGINGLHRAVEEPNEQLLRDLQRVTVKLWLAERGVEPVMENTMEGPRGLPLFTMLMAREGSLPPGVGMRVVRNHDRAVVYDTAPAMPKVMEIEQRLLERRHFFHDYFRYRVVSMNDRLQLFYHKELIDWGGMSYTVYLMSAVAVDHEFMRGLSLGLLCVDILAIVLALGMCHWLTGRALEPLAKITEELQAIEVGQLGHRVTVPEAKDEINSLAGSVNHMLDRLEAGLEREQRFVSDASHELRTPLSIILGHAGLLRRWGSGDKELLEESLETIYSEAAGMSTLVGRLLELARADQKRLKLKPVVMDIGELVDQLYRELLPVVELQELELEQCEPGYVLADRDVMRELMLILLDNARKYTPEGGKISLFSRREDNMMHLGVRDTGIGIKAEDVPHLFERFYRVDDTRTRGTGGAGLGLALAEQLVLAHDGQIRVESEIGKGTCMHVYLPLLELE